MLRIFLIFSTILFVLALPQNVPMDASRNTAEVISFYGYQSESHKVVTEDGYILEMQRIPYKRGETSGSASRPVVFLMHGLMAASYQYIFLGPEYSIAYNLADAGFDVWMGNARGNKNSRSHVSLDPDADHLEFFDYTWEEIGLYDVPAMVDYILDFTGRQKLHYVGHSQGGTVFLVLNSMRVEYNEKFASAHLLAGVGYQEYFPDRTLGSLAIMTDIIYSVAVATGNIEISSLFESEDMRMGSKNYDKLENCFGDVEFKSMCELIRIRHYLREDLVPELEDMGGGSLKLAAHYGQNIRDKLFRRWSYGSRQNEQIYGTRDPPLYDLRLITVNTTMHYTLNDTLLDERDVLAMAADMPNTVVRKVARESFLHEDFAMAPDVKELVTEFMTQEINFVEEMLYPESSDNQDSIDNTNQDNDSNQDNESNQGNDSNQDNESNQDNDSNQDNESNQDNDGGETESDSLPSSSSFVSLCLPFKMSLIIFSFKSVLTV